MKKTIYTVMMLLLGAGAISAQQFTTETGMVSFHSDKHNITPASNAAVSTLNTETGEMQFSVPVQSIEFDKKMMQDHFNAPGVMDSQQFPRIKFTGKIDNLEEINFAEDGEYPVKVSGQLTIKDVTKDIVQEGTVMIKDGAISANSEFDLDRFEYGVKSKAAHISQVLQIVVKAEYAASAEETHP